MRNAKRLIAVLMILIFALSLAACSNSTPNVAPPAKVQTAADKGYANKEATITPQELKALVDKNAVKIIDVRKKSPYEKEHIAGAVNTYREDYEDKNHKYAGMAATAEQFAALLSKLGVKNDDLIVICTDNSDKHSHADAARFWWILDMYGHKKVRILDGGLEAWKAAGYPVTQELPKVTPTTYKVTSVDKSKLADVDEVIAQVNKKDPKVVILDTREKEEFTGDTQVRGASRKGRIPGAVYLYWMDTLNPDKTYKTAAELKKMMEEKGITPDKTIIPYCQSGVRSAQMTFVLTQLLGYKNVKNYDGSWIEWSARQDLPIETGPAK